MPLPDVDDIDTLGGSKTNFSEVEDPTTDLDAEEHNVAINDLAMLTHVSTRAWAKITLAATTGAMTLDDHDAMWGDTVGVAPVQARSSGGVYTLTYPTTVLDELGDSHTLNLRAAWVNVRSATRQRIQCQVTAANVITIYTYNSSDAATDSTSQIDVFAI